MGKTIILNLTDIELKGNILDVGESYGVIYNMSKEIDDEISIDTIISEGEGVVTQERYDSCTVFFYLSSIWSMATRYSLLKDVSKYIRKGGSIYIWDVNKDVGEMVSNKIRVLLPSSKVKEFEFKNLNPISKSASDETKIMLEKNFRITETKEWEDVYFIKATRI
ncbi:MAG: hypothetical protein RR620_07040 [Clostridium sp.]